MNRGKVKYIAFYSNNQLVSENRIHLLAATNKIDYICTALNKNGYQVELISPSWIIENRGFFSGKLINIGNKNNLRFFSSFGAQIRLFRILRYIWSLVQLVIYLIINTKKEETVFVYHSPILSLPLRIVKKIKKIKIILEVEEIYSSIQKSDFFKNQEIKAFKAADKYIFSTENLNTRLNLESKPYSILYGTYKVEKDYKDKINDETIHIVYAGTFDAHKGGAYTAIKVAEFLDTNYHIHIIGFGSDREVSDIKNEILRVTEKTDCKVTYDGLLQGEYYTRFLQRCDIGLSTQIPEAIYNETSFPSKILSYMANGLQVITVRINVIENSEISASVNYYDKNDPMEIANVIKQIAKSPKEDTRKLIRKLDNNFVQEISTLLKD